MTRDVRVLVTGFGPFPGVPHNVSSEIAEACASAWSVREGMVADCLILDTTWQTAPTSAREQLERSRPDIIIHLGVSELATNLTLETYAYNECDARPDATGNTPEKTLLSPGRPATHKTPAPIEKMASVLQSSGHRVTISDDPGRYLCNAVYHQTLCHQDDNATNDALCIFVHIPTQLGPNTVTRASVLHGLDLILDTMLAH